MLFEDKGIRDAFRGSTRLVRGHWFYTLRVAGFLWLLSIVAGPALGLALVFTEVPLWSINLLGSIVFALLIPYVAIARTLLYFDLRADRGAGPGRAGRVRARAAPGDLMALTEAAERWRDRGRETSFRSHRIHVFERDGEGAALALLHGFPSSSFDWRARRRPARRPRR